jgi:hypothetical protein
MQRGSVEGKHSNVEDYLRRKMSIIQGFSHREKMDLSPAGGLVPFRLQLARTIGQLARLRQ